MSILPPKLIKIAVKFQKFAWRNKIVVSVAIVIFVIFVVLSAAIIFTVLRTFQKSPYTISGSSIKKVLLSNDRLEGSIPKGGVVDTTVSSPQNKAGDNPVLNDAPSLVSKDSESTTKPSDQSSANVLVDSPSPTPAETPETPDQIFKREYKNLFQAYYSISPVPTRSESGGFIYYTINLQVTAFDDVAFGHPTMYIQLIPSVTNHYSCVNPVGTMATFVYGTGGNTVSVSCQVRACPECYPTPYGAFSAEAGAFISSGQTGTVSRPYDLEPGYDKPS